MAQHAHCRVCDAADRQGAVRHDGQAMCCVAQQAVCREARQTSHVLCGAADKLHGVWPCRRAVCCVAKLAGSALCDAPDKLCGQFKLDQLNHLGWAGWPARLAG